MDENNNILRGWKEIEKYTRLGRGAIIRNNYPVHSEINKSVYALKSEIDDFLLRKQSLCNQMSKDS